ncbi:MAG: hypothetical protein D4R93_02965 [Deltaproteobacteria bacterium]|nr:MAG: hypothetical protein D4R93_02965 [Deltaproteobacteria bacterium]
MLKMGREKDPENILREEMLKERAEVLGRAGERLATSIEKMSIIEQGIDERLQHFRLVVKKCEKRGGDNEIASLKQDILGEINREIGKFNRAREYAKVRYYYLIVTREAMGMRRHHWVDEWYRIPPRKPHFRDI